jgi:hypothetical protein
VRVDQQRPDSVRKGVTLLPLRVKALLVRGREKVRGRD